MASTNLSKKEYGCKGDPRMHRAVALKLANPDLTLYEALVMGGFQYASDDRNSTDGIDQVTLRQRKNNLSRRVRQAQELQRNNQQRFLELHKQPLGSIGPVLTSRIGSIPLDKTADNDNNWASSDKTILPESFGADPISLEESCVATQQHQFKSLRSHDAFMGPLEKKPFSSRYYEQMGQRIPNASQKSVTDFLGASLAVEKGSLDISQCDFEPLSFPGPDEFAPSLDFKKEPCLPQPPFKTDHSLKRNASELGRAEEAKQGIKRACIANNGKDSLHRSFLSGSFSFLGDLEPVPMGAAAPVASKDEPKQEGGDGAKRTPFSGSNEPFLPPFQATSLSEDIFSTLIHDLKAFADQKPLSASKMDDSRMEKAKALFSVEMNALYERCMLLAGYSQEEIRDTSQEKLIFARYAWELEGKRLRETIGRWLANNAQTTPTANKVLQSNQ